MLNRFNCIDTVNQINTHFLKALSKYVLQMIIHNIPTDFYSNSMFESYS